MHKPPKKGSQALYSSPKEVLLFNSKEKYGNSSSVVEFMLRLVALCVRVGACCVILPGGQIYCRSPTLLEENNNVYFCPNHLWPEFVLILSWDACRLCVQPALGDTSRTPGMVCVALFCVLLPETFNLRMQKLMCDLDAMIDFKTISLLSRRPASVKGRICAPTA